MAEKVFYLDRRDIYDGLESAKHKISKPVLFRYLNERGIYPGKNESREVLVELAVDCFEGYRDLLYFSRHLETISKRDKVSFSHLDVEITTAEANGIYEEIKSKLNKQNIRVVGNSEGHLQLEHTFDVIHLSKTRMQQRQTKCGTIDIEYGSKGVIVRYSDNQETTKVAGDIVSIVKSNRSLDDEVLSLIDLSAFEAKKITQFFIKLVSSLNGYDYKNIEKVSLDIRAEKDKKKKEELEEEVVGSLRKAKLEGSQITSTSFYKDLIQNDYFISRAVWQVVEKNRHGSIIEIEAGFTDAPACSMLNFIIKNERKSDKEGGYLKTPVQVSEDKEIAVFQSLEKSALSIYREIINEE